MNENFTGSLLYEFIYKKTNRGITVSMRAPTGRVEKAHFRDNHGSAIEKAKDWVWSRRNSILDAAQTSGYKVNIRIPPDIDRTTASRTITMEVAIRESVVASAENLGLSVSQWIRKAASERLEKEFDLRNPQQAIDRKIFSDIY